MAFAASPLLSHCHGPCGITNTAPQRGLQKARGAFKHNIAVACSVTKTAALAWRATYLAKPALRVV